MADPVRDNPNEEVEAQRPDWLPDNFDNPEALVKSYQEAQRKISELGEKAAQVDVLEQNLNDLVSQFEESQQQPAVQANDLVSMYEQAMEQGDYRSALAINDEVVRQRIDAYTKQSQQNVAPLAQSQSAIVADMAFRDLEAQYPNVTEHQSQMAEIIKTQPWLYPDDANTNPVLARQSLETIYKLVNPSDFVEPQSLNTTAMKRQAQTMTGAGARPPTPDENTAHWERVKSAGSSGYESGLRGN